MILTKSQYNIDGKHARRACLLSKKTKVTEYQAADVSTLLYKYVDSVLS